jgi:hypothetical protein
VSVRSIRAHSRSKGVGVVPIADVATPRRMMSRGAAEAAEEENLRDEQCENSMTLAEGLRRIVNDLPDSASPRLRVSQSALNRLPEGLTEQALVLDPSRAMPPLRERRLYPISSPESRAERGR